MLWREPLMQIRKQLAFYIEKNNIKSLVLGVSGGIDSALIAAIAAPVCKKIGINLFGRSLPGTSNKQDEIVRASAVGYAFCQDFDTYHINELFQEIFVNSETKYSSQKDEKFNKIAQGNIKARIRMIMLYDLAYRTQGMVLSTDNLTEMLLGFWSLHGDVGDYGLIQNLWKTEVYDLAHWICENELTISGGGYDNRGQALNSCITAVPTDGLGITNSDLDQLEASTYEEVDRILKIWLTTDIDAFTWDDYLIYPNRPENYEDLLKERDLLKSHPVVQRHINSEFKRNNPINLQRTEIFKY